MKKLHVILFFTLHFSLFTCLCSAQTGTWSAVKNLAPHYCNGGLTLLTDGRVICHTTHGPGNGTGWDVLTPDSNGSYINGTWDTISSMHLDRLFFSTQVLPSGKVYVAGGEYGAGDTAGEVYDPAANTWTMCGPPPSGWNIFDGNSEMLYNGNVLEGPQIGANPSFDCLFWSPVTNNYTIAPIALYNHDEAQWLKLPDSSVIFVGIATDYSNRYIPQTNTWVYDDTVPGNLYDPFGEEAGCALMLPNGNAIFFGATPYNAIYTPGGNHTHGTWASADSFPVIDGSYVGQPDASGDMMVNGRILLAVSPIGTSQSNEFLDPCYFLEYDYTTNTFARVTAPIPGFGGDSLPAACYQTNMINLPDGNVLVSNYQQNFSNQYFVYTPGSAPIPQGKPTINSITETSCGYYTITGKLFNGISEGSAYGDDWQMETNYPIVRLTNGSRVYYAKTTNWNRIGAIQTDSLEDTANFILPSMPGGTYSLVVVANGFASNPTLFTTFGVVITAQTNIVGCIGNNGSATAFASQGITPYTYSWSPTGGTNSTASNLTSGTYTITVTDNGGCSVSASVDIVQPGALSVLTINTEVSCRGGANGIATAGVSGGTYPYTYSWSGGLGTNASVSGLSTGSYTVTVFDSCGNTASTIANITQPGILSVYRDSVIDVPCNGENTGSANAYVLGGTSPFTYLWSGGEGTNAIATGLSAGTYTVNVSDSCGSTATLSVSITQPSPMLVIIDSSNAGGGGCNGKAWVTVSGGTPGYNYSWTPNGETTATITGQCAGNYCCTVTDNNGCSETACVDISTGINELAIGSGQWLVYPNPSNGMFTIVGTQNFVSCEWSVEVYNVFGQKIYSSILPQILKGALSQIDLSRQPNGVYFYRVLSEGTPLGKEDGGLVGEGKVVIQK